MGKLKHNVQKTRNQGCLSEKDAIQVQDEYFSQLEKGLLWVEG